MKLTDEHIKGITKGDIKSFRLVYDEMYHSLCLYGYKILPDQHTVNDIVQSAFILLWEKREEFHSALGTKSYLYAMVRNRILNYIRDNKTVSLEELDIGEEVDFDMQITTEETYKILRDAVSQLPAQTRKIFELVLNGSSNNDIAGSLDVSINTVKTLKRRGLISLREMLKDNVIALMLLADLLGK